MGSVNFPSEEFMVGLSAKFGFAVTDSERQLTYNVRGNLNKLAEASEH